jgi:hypothetical protein
MNPTSAPASGSSPAASRTYHVTALEMTVYFNREGDHDHNGLVYALTDNVPILKYLQALSRGHDRPRSGRLPRPGPRCWACRCRKPRQRPGNPTRWYGPWCCGPAWGKPYAWNCKTTSATAAWASTWWPTGTT